MGRRGWAPTNPCKLEVSGTDYVLVDAEGKRFEQLYKLGHLDKQRALRQWDHMYHTSIVLEDEPHAPDWYWK